MTLEQRILGIDYGTKNIGLAISDPLSIIAQSLETIENNIECYSIIKRIIEREYVALIVVGMPLNLKGERAQKSLEVEEFIKNLRTHTDIDVVDWDERFTSTMAQRSLLQFGVKKKKRGEKGRIDSMAAAIMLQSYLDSRKQTECS